MAKCNAYCDHYEAYKTEDEVCTYCKSRNLKIIDIKTKLPNIYNDCDRFCPSKKYYKQPIKKENNN